MAGFSALTGLVSGTELCSSREQTNQKPMQVFMCACQAACSRLGQRDLVWRRCVWEVRSWFSSPLIMAGWAAGLTQLLTRCSPGCPDLLLQALGFLESTQCSGELCLQTKLPIWGYPSTLNREGKCLSKAAALLFSPCLNLSAKYNSVPVFRSVLSFAICFPLLCWANGRRGPAAEEKKKFSIHFKFLKPFCLYSDKIYEWKVHSSHRYNLNIKPGE